MKKLFLSLSLFLVSPAFATPFRIAAIYPNSTVGHFNCTCGLEAACMTEGVIQRAQKEGTNISFTLVNKDWDMFKSIEAANKVAEEGFDAAVGTLVSTDALATADILERAGIPFVVPTATNPKITAEKKFVTRIAFNDFRQAKLLARFSLKNLSVKRVAIIRITSFEYSDFLGTQFAKEIRGGASQTAISEFPIVDGFSDFPRLVKEVLATSPDLIFVPLPQAYIASIYVELVKAHSKLTLLSSDTIEKKPQFLDVLGPKSEDIHFIYPQHWDGRLRGPERRRYSAIRRGHCSQYPDSMTTVAAYDAINLLLAALRKEPEARGERLIQVMRSIPYQGMTGLMRYGEDGDPIKTIQLFHLVHGEVKRLKRLQ